MSIRLGHHCFGEHHQDSSRRVLGSLNEAMKIYDSLAGYEAEDVLLDGAVIDTHEEVAKLPQLHSNLCAVFKEVSSWILEVIYHFQFVEIVFTQPGPIYGHWF